MRYGRQHINAGRGFSWEHGISHWRPRAPASRLGVLPARFIPTRAAYTLAPGIPPPGRPTLLRPRSAPCCRCRNFNLLPIDYACRLRLRDRLTLPGLSLDRKPWASGDEGFHLVYRYSCQHSHFLPLHRPSPGGFVAAGTLPYQNTLRCNPWLR